LKYLRPERFMIRYAVTGGEGILIKNPRVTYAPIVGSLFPAEIR
jgi:hypothetical protein